MLPRTTQFKRNEDLLFSVLVSFQLLNQHLSSLETCCLGVVVYGSQRWSSQLGHFPIGRSHDGNILRNNQSLSLNGFNHPANNRFLDSDDGSDSRIS